MMPIPNPRYSQIYLPSISLDLNHVIVFKDSEIESKLVGDHQDYIWLRKSWLLQHAIKYS